MRESFSVPADDETDPVSGLRAGDRLRDRTDESLEDVLDTAELLQKIEGTEEVAKMDALLSWRLPAGIVIGFNWDLIY